MASSRVPLSATSKKYVEKEAAHSGSESEGSSNSESSSSSMKDFIDDSGSGTGSGDDEEEEKKPSKLKRPRTTAPPKSKSTAPASAAAPAVTIKSKKQILIPSAPKLLEKKSEKKKNYDFRITITNGQNFLRFMLPVANAVNEMRFNLAMTPVFTGLRLEAHDTCATLANISKFDCDIDPGVSGPGEKTLTKEEVSAITFCVATKTFMQTMNCSVLKEAVLTITRYNHTSDALTFESASNEDDVRAVYSCALLDQSSQEPLQFSINLNFHVTVELKTLKELSQNAKKCGAASIRFEVFQRVDESDESIVHSRMSIGFKSGSTSGNHGFYHSARKSIRNGVVEWTSIPGSSRSQEGMEQKCNNSYDISKLRTFLSHMDCEWALIHLPDDNTEQPLVIECDLGGPNTRHTIIISPNLAEAD